MRTTLAVLSLLLSSGPAFSQSVQQSPFEKGTCYPQIMVASFIKNNNFSYTTTIIPFLPRGKTWESPLSGVEGVFVKTLAGKPLSAARNIFFTNMKRGDEVINRLSANGMTREEAEKANTDATRAMYLLLKFNGVTWNKKIDINSQFNVGTGSFIGLYEFGNPTPYYCAL